MKQPFFYASQHDRADTVEFFNGGGHTLPHFHRCIEIIYMKGGALGCVVNGTQFCALPDEIVFVHKCCVHELIPAPAYENHVLIVGPRYSDDIESIFQKRTLPAHLTDKEFNRTLRPYFERLGALVGENNADAELIIKGYIDVIVGSLLRHYERVPTDAMPNLGTVVAVLNYIDDHFTEPITLDSISSVFGYNKYYFSRLFNRYIGENLNNYINMIRVRNLVTQAKKADSPGLAALVFENGFDSMTTFYRSFSRFYDRPPTEIFKDK